MQVNIALLTVTDTRTIDTDKSGSILVKKINEQNHKLIDKKIDDAILQARLKRNRKLKKIFK